MKKTICIILACFLLVMTPIKGYATSAPLVFGIGEEVILPFLLSLLGVQAVNQIDSYEDLVSYNNEVYDSLTKSLSGLAGFEAIQAWLLKAVSGIIETNSIIWEKLRELALSNYVLSSEGNIIASGNVLGLESFTYQTLPAFYEVTSKGIYRGTEQCSFVWSKLSNFYSPLFASSSSTFRGQSYRSYSQTWGNLANRSYTYDDRTVYYYYNSSGSANVDYNPSIFNENTDMGKSAWLMVYGEFIESSANIAEYSGAFDLALNAQQKEDIIDGTSVIQLYNPADEQNGLHFVPDPEEPDDIKIPFAVTADWWNYLKQFGNDTKDQVVQAYNALNGLSGNSIGSISDAYDRLGIASVLSSAQSAADGIASLTDSNVYPNSLTVADAINNSIPSSLTPQSPDDGIDNESEQGLYKLPDLRDYFPFCIPFDLIDLLSCFVAEPETPSFVIALSTGEETVSGNMDLHIWDNIAGVIRTFELIGFTVGLILITRNIIRG